MLNIGDLIIATEDVYGITDMTCICEVVKMFDECNDIEVKVIGFTQEVDSDRREFIGRVFSVEPSFFTIYKPINEISDDEIVSDEETDSFFG